MSLYSVSIAACGRRGWRGGGGRCDEIQRALQIILQPCFISFLHFTPPFFNLYICISETSKTPPCHWRVIRPRSSTLPHCPYSRAPLSSCRHPSSPQLLRLRIHPTHRHLPRGVAPLPNTSQASSATGPASSKKLRGRSITAIKANKGKTRRTRAPASPAARTPAGLMKTQPRPCVVRTRVASVSRCRNSICGIVNKHELQSQEGLVQDLEALLNS